jgi:hypothetical protein
VNMIGFWLFRICVSCKWRASYGAGLFCFFVLYSSGAWVMAQAHILKSTVNRVTLFWFSFIFVFHCLHTCSIVQSIECVYIVRVLGPSFWGCKKLYSLPDSCIGVALPLPLVRLLAHTLGSSSAASAAAARTGKDLRGGEKVIVRLFFFQKRFL